MTSLFICGMPAAGKSRSAKAIADHLGCHFLDLDAEIEYTHGPIPGLFEKGEAHFRQIEADTLQKICAGRKEPFVLALGGGTLERSENLNLILQSGILIYLDLELAEIDQRLSVNQESEKRPLLAPKEGNQRVKFLREMCIRRSVQFKQSHIITTLEPIPDMELFTKRIELFTKRSPFLPFQGQFD